MSSRIRDAIRNQWMGALALFLVLTGGSAYATHETIRSSDIVDNEVRTADVRDDTLTGGGLRTPDIATGAIRSSDVLDNSLTGADLAPSALPIGRAKTSSCDPDTTDFVDCGTLTINLPRPGLRVLIVASGMWWGLNASSGTCRIGVNGSPFGPDVFPGELVDTTDPIRASSLTLTNVTDPNLGAGNHTIGLACNQLNGDIRFDETMVSVVVLGPA